MSAPTRDWLLARHAWVAGLTACAINALTTPYILFVGRDVAGLPQWPVWSSSAVGALGAAVLLLRRSRTPRWTSSAVFLVNNTAVTLCVWFIIPWFATAGAPWTPFQVNKLGMLIVAALAPEPVVGALCIGSLAGCGLLRMSTLSSPSAVDEPAVLLIFTLTAVALLALRRRGVKSEYELVQSRADAEAATELSRRLLALRDLANTPLQTIEVAIAVLERRHPDARGLTSKMSRAVARMRGLEPLMNGSRRNRR